MGFFWGTNAYTGCPNGCKQDCSHYLQQQFEQGFTLTLEILGNEQINTFIVIDPQICRLEVILQLDVDTAVYTLSCAGLIYHATE